MSESRRKLPNRRASIVVTFDLDGIVFRAQVSRFEDGKLAEVFLNGGKIGSAVAIAAHDAAVAASLALQFGCPASTLSHALLKLPSGESAGPLGKCLDLAGAYLDA